MAAGAPTNSWGPVDWNGLEAAATIQSWPHRPPQNRGFSGHNYPPPEKEYSTSNNDIGTRIRCHISQPHEHPRVPAGQSARVHAFYHKTGGTSHRTEPEFLNTKGASSLTEANTDPLYARPTQQYHPNELVLTRGSREKRGVPTISSAGSAIVDVPYELRSQRSGSNRSRGNSSARGALSARSGGSNYSGRLHTIQDWDFDRRPMYETAAMDYGKGWDAVPDPAAGKSWSGFMEPTKLVAKLTERERQSAY